MEVKKKTQTKGGIALPDDFQEEGAKQARLVAMGPMVSVYFTRNAKPGDTVVTKEGFHAQKVILDDDSEFLCVPEQNVLCVVPE